MTISKAPSTFLGMCYSSTPLPVPKSVLLFHFCCNKLPQIYSLKQQKFVLLTILEARIQNTSIRGVKLKCGQSCTPFRTSRGDPLACLFQHSDLHSLVHHPFILFEVRGVPSSPTLLLFVVTWPSSLVKSILSLPLLRTFVLTDNLTISTPSATYAVPFTTEGSTHRFQGLGPGQLWQPLFNLSNCTRMLFLPPIPSCTSPTVLPELDPSYSSVSFWLNPLPLRGLPNIPIYKLTLSLS